MSAKRKIYRVAFLNEGEVWEVFCTGVSQSNLFGFVELEGFLFGEKSTVLVDPAEERLKHVFQGVERTYVPLQAVVRIDEVEKRGSPNIHPAPAEAERGKVVTLPSSVPTPRKRR